jgi:chromosome segregation ATPase
MIKKLALLIGGGALVLVLLFGSRLIPYAKTSLHKVRQAAQDAVPVSMQIDTARDQLKNVDREIRDMMMNVAKEEVDVRSVKDKLANGQSELDRQYTQIMRLKEHLDSGDEVYTSRSGKTYANERVRDDLKSRFRVYQTCERTLADLAKTLELREQGLEAAKSRLEQTISQRRELEIEIENLVARKQMVDVSKTANKLNFDGSELAETREMIQDISTKIEVEAQMLQLTPEFVGAIPAEDDSEASDVDISQQVEEYFNRDKSTDFAAK